MRVGGAVELERLAHLDHGVEPGLLQHDPDPRAERALAPRGVVAEHGDAAGVGAAVAFEDLDQRRLAGAVGAEQREHLAARDRQVHAVERAVAVGLAQAADPTASRSCRSSDVMPSSIGFAARLSSSARGSNSHLHPWVETDSTRRAPMTTLRREAPRPYRAGTDGPPQALRALGSSRSRRSSPRRSFTDPQPGCQGDGPLVTLGIVLLVGGLVAELAWRPMSAPRRALRRARRRRRVELLLAAVQPDGAGYAGVYFVMVIGGMRLDRDAAIVVCGGTVGGAGRDPAARATRTRRAIAGLLFSVLPWFLVMRLIACARLRRAENVEELRESRAAHAESAALAERGRVARELHDVLAHSLSALALQLEGTRLLARDRGADPEVVEGLERAHHLARRAERGAPGDHRPARRRPARARGPRRQLPGRDAHASAARRASRPPRRGSRSTARPRRRSPTSAATARPTASSCGSPTSDDGTTLTVQDHGDAAPAIGGSGYGLTGMRERAELLGGRLNAGPDRRRLPGGAVAAGVIRVLLADDQRVVREGLGTLLGLLDGIELVGTAADGEEALALAAEHNPDVVLMDLRMPRMDGIEAIRRLAARERRARSR